MEITKLPDEYDMEFLEVRKMYDKAKEQSSKCTYCNSGYISRTIKDLYEFGWDCEAHLRISKEDFKSQFPRFLDRKRIKKRGTEYVFYKCKCICCGAEWNTDIYRKKYLDKLLN